MTLRMPSVAVAVAAVAAAVLSPAAAQNIVVEGLPPNGSVGYTFPEIGTNEMTVEIHDVNGNTVRTFCANVNPQSPGACAFSIVARMTYTDTLLNTVQVQGGGYFQQGRARYTTPSVFNGFLQTLLPSPILLKAGTLQVTVTASGRQPVTTSVAVLPGAPAFLFFEVSTTQLVAGTNAQVLVQMMDTHNNVATNAVLANAVATLTGSVTSFPTQSVALTAGSGSFSFTSTTIETVTVAVSQPAVSATNASQSVTIVPAATATVLWNASNPTFLQEGNITNQVLRLRAFDRFGNFNSGENRVMGVARNGVTLTPPTPLQFINGLLTVSLESSLGPGDYNYTTLPGTAFVSVNTAAFVVVRVTVVCDGINFFQDVPNQIVCQNVTTVCGVGTFEAAGPTRSSNRNCTACDGVTEFQNTTGASACLPMSANCTAGQFQLVAASPSTDRVCAACGPATFSDEVNALNCSNVTECVAGQEMVANYTSISDRQCLDCASGFADEDSDPYATPCTSCITSLSAVATFTNNVTVTFSQNFNSTMTFATVGASSLSSSLEWGVFNLPCSSLTPTSTHLFNCGNSSAFPRCGNLSARFGSLASLSEGGPIPDLTLSLEGANNVEGRFLAVYDSAGAVRSCAGILQDPGSDAPTLTSLPGQTECRNVTTCEAGQEEATPFTYSADRTCQACVVNVTFKSDPDDRFCRPVQRCAVGFSETSPATVSSDAVCTGVTCPSLNPPAHGSITNCRGSGFNESYLTSCTYSCDVSRAFRPLNFTRTCQDNGAFDGIAPTCQCEGNLHLDAANSQCVNTCPDGSIAAPSASGSATSCRTCTSECSTGFFESTACDPLTNTDRVCSQCRVCSAGTFAVGGCFPNNDTDTVCEPFRECEPGTYEVVPGNPTTDRQCGACRACTNTTNSATLNTLYAAGGCCGSTNTICDGINQCPAGYFVSEEPLPFVQGGWGTDRRCKRIRQCGVGEYIFAEPTRVADIAVTDRDCRNCEQCPLGTITVANCTSTANTQCAPHPLCPAGQYRSNATAFSNGTCTTCTACASFEFAARPCGGINDTVCQALTVCDPVSEYEVSAADPTTDRVCGNCTVCGANEYIAEQCDTNTPGRCSNNSADEVCRRGTARIANVAGISFCAPCAECPAGTFTKGGARCPFTRPELGYTDPRCFNVTVCPTGFAEAAAPTPTSDRVCVRCAQCPSGSFTTSRVCVANVADLNCTVDPPCASNEYAIVRGTATRPQVCATCRTCSVDEFAAVPCDGLTNRVCRKHQECASNEALLRRGTATADAICRNCSSDVQGTARPFNDPFLCPLAPFASVCPAAAPQPYVPTAPYSLVQFSFPGNYSLIVGSPSHTARHDLFNSDLLAYLRSLTPGFNPSPYTSLTSAAGSIVVTITVETTNQTNTTVDHAEAVTNLTSILTSTFSFEYEGTALSINGGAGGVVVSVPTSSPSVPAGTDAPTATPSTTPSPGAEEADGDKDDNDSLSTGAIVAIAIGSLLLLLNIAAIAYHHNRKADPWTGKNSTVYNPNATADDDDDEEDTDYLNMTSAADGEPNATNIFSNQVAEENRRLKEEIDSMGLKISEKNAVINAQMTSRKHTEHVLERAVASKLTEENKAIQREIASMKRQLRKTRDASKFQRAAATQAKLKAERTALEDEIITADEVAQTALVAVSEFGSLEDAIADHDASASAEAERIAAEKARLSAEMAKMSERLASM